MGTLGAAGGGPRHESVRQAVVANVGRALLLAAPGGNMRWKTANVFVALDGEPVGLERIDDERVARLVQLL